MVAPNAKYIPSGRVGNPWKFTTFFFSHFSISYGERVMWKIFQRWERVEEVFVSTKLNRRDKRVGTVKNDRKLQSEMDFVRIGAMKLYAYIPRYRKYDDQLLDPHGTHETRPKHLDKHRKVKEGKVAAIEGKGGTTMTSSEE